MGTGPASHLAMNRKPGAVILFMPFKSIRSVVETYVKASFLSKTIVNDYFNNY